ncbi:zinc finger CCHC domain-containing protein 2 isoform X2 [Thalassophryne amazonica]|uniref:zinc finger CCHC domain-containing protein 2 isoform X2 n=1 Tax=Thalassophryne amazonica TaxID=390379 RepID=UPI0014723129|nr:zinc finger CCHC domain-containing protein 2 isoform X2 [Thalassophryne amazonica]
MLKMKLLSRTGRRGGEEEEEAAEHRPLDQPGAQSERIHWTQGDFHPAQLDKENVFEWFGLHLDPAKRLEVMCGLLHMCQPLELRFIGSCLEDLARKDYHILRDFELRANNPNDLGALTDVADSVIRSKLLVCLSLLGSDSRECAGILFGILSHIDPLLFCTNSDHCPALGEPPGPDGTGSCGLSAGDPAAEALQQLALLFTMASLHPAFHFHQQESIRAQLDKMQHRTEEERLNGPNTEPNLTCQREEYRPSTVLALGECTPSHHTRRSGRRAAQREAVHIERIVLRGIFQSRIDKEYNFEVQWSDSSSSSVTKTHLELENFLLKLPKEQCTESFARSILRLLNEAEHHEARDIERNLRESFLSAPPVFRQTRKVCSFFNCDSINLTKPTCCRSKCQLGKVYHDNCSDCSSQDEDLESYVHGHKKKHGSKGPCHGAKGSPAEAWRGIRSSELSGPADRRKKSCMLRSSQDAAQQQDGEKRSHSVKTKTRVLPTDRDIGKVKVLGSACVTNGCVLPVHLSQGKGRRSRLEMLGDTSSEAYSSPPSPQHLDSDDDNNKDTDSHSDNSTKVPDTVFTEQTNAVMGNLSSVLPLSSSTHHVQTDVLCPESTTNFPPLSFVNSLPYALNNGGAENPMNPPHSQSFGPEGKSLPATIMMQMPLVPLGVPGPGIVGATEKREILPTFGIPTLGLHPPMSPAMQPLVQRFNTALSHSSGGTDGTSGIVSGSAATQSPHEAPVRALSGLSSGSTSYSSTLQSCQDPVIVTSCMTPSLPVAETSHAKHPGLNLAFGLPSSYTVPSVSTSAMPTLGGPAATEMPSPGHVQTSAPPDVPPDTPGSVPSSSPAPVHSLGHSEYTSYYNSDTLTGSSAVTPGNPLVQQQQDAPNQQQQPVGCGTCGCHNNCGGRGTINTNSGVSGATGCQAPLFFPQHQMAARQVFSISPALFHLTSLSSNSYLTQGQCPHQANSGAATLSAFFPTSPPPPAHPPPYGPIHRPLHTHSNSHADVPSHMLGTQAAAAAAAANYNLQQQMGPAPAFCQRIYQNMYPNSLGLQPAAAVGGGGINKKNGNVSCYNCGMSGHYAQDCSQPSIDSTQQGGFQLKYTASHISEAPDNTD